jgi:hypothetical protein
MGLIFFTIILFHSVYSTSGSTCTVPLTWDERYEPFIRCAGFLPLAQLVTTRGLPLMHSTTLTSLVDRWHPETHMFHLSCGETTMMLQDVTMILGLPIDGTPVCGMVSSAGVTPGFKAKTRCSSYVCSGSSCHTYGQNVSTKYQ